MTLFAGFSCRFSAISPESMGRRRAGAVTVWLLISLLVIVGILAIGMDGGRMMEKRRHVQAAADAAALVAANELYSGNFVTKGKGWGRRKNSAKDAAVELASANGFSNDGTTSTVTVNVPPKSGAFTGRKDCAEVIVEYYLPYTFSAVFTKNKLPVKARAVAVGRPFPMGLILLRQTGANAFLNNSLATFTVVNGRIYVNSSDPAAFNQAKPGIVVADAYYLTGNYVNPGGAVILGRMRTGTRRVGDPLRSLPAPDPAALSVESNSTLTSSGPKKLTLQPGIYKGGIKFDNLANVVMLPGVYIMEGGGFQVTGLATVAGTEVLIYNTSGASPAGSIDINTLGKVVLTAPLSGIYQGIGIFQDRGVTQPVNITGNGTAAIVGTVYAAGAAVNLTGNVAAAVDTLGGAYICSSLQVGGVGSINIDLGSNAPPVAEITLVE